MRESLLQKNMVNNMFTGADPICPSIMANDIDGAFYWVERASLIEIITHFKLPKEIVITIATFISDRTIAMSVEGETEAPAKFTAALPQGSPLSPVLFIL